MYNYFIYGTFRTFGEHKNREHKNREEHKGTVPLCSYGWCHQKIESPQQKVECQVMPILPGVLPYAY